MGYYDIAQICLNGHAISAFHGSQAEHRKDYCDKCGESTITACSHCNTSIQGYYHCDVVVIGSAYKPPAYCHSCGRAYPWTERSIHAAIELFAEEISQDETEQTEFEKDLRDITTDNPRARVAGIRIKKILAKTGGVVGKAMRDIVVEVAAEVAKKSMGL